jgi:3-oxoacyl-[acyl-carrier protein] reductase
MSGATLKGRVAVVTGSGRNIGRAIALELARAGAAVVVNARSAANEAEAVVEDIRKAGGRATLELADITDPAAVDGLMASAVESFGRLDILVNNAGVRKETAFADLGYAEWKQIIGIILDGAYLCTHAALPHLIASGQGAIVNIGGLSAHTGSAKRAHVIAAKMGVVGLTRALAHDLAPHSITVNCVSPGVDRYGAPGELDRRRAGPSRRALAAGRPQRQAGRDRHAGPLPQRPGGALHNRPNHSCQRRAVPAVTAVSFPRKEYP